MPKIRFIEISATALLLAGLPLAFSAWRGSYELQAVDTSAPAVSCECNLKPGYIGSTMNETCDFHRKADRTGSGFAAGYVLYDMYENGNYLVLFHRTPDVGRDRYCSVVLDVLSIPLDTIPEGLVAVGQQCFYDDIHDPEIFVLAPKEEADLHGTENGWRAWRANRGTGKIEPVDAKRVRCSPCLGLFCV